MEQHSLFSQPVTWVIAAVLSVYLFVLCRALFVFLFRGGRQKLIDQETAVAQMQEVAKTAEVAPEPSPSPKPGIKALRLLA